MAILTTRPRGTNDFLPAETPRWQYVERTLLSTAALYGYGEIRTPTFEHTELFQRGVGDTTDVVNKEMYTFTDKGDRSITLRPEGTAGICRAAIENGLLGDALPLKVSYVFNCFRYEKAQRGRFRQFHQFGVECYGATGPVTDAEVISLAWEGMQTLGLKDLTLAINSIAAPPAAPSTTRPCAPTSRAAGRICARPVRSAWRKTPCAFWIANPPSAARSPKAPPVCWIICAMTAGTTLRKYRPF